MSVASLIIESKPLAFTPSAIPFSFPSGDVYLFTYIWIIYKHKLPAVCRQGSYDDAELSLQTEQGWRDIRSP